MLFSKYSKIHYDFKFFWKNVNKQLKSADFSSEKSKFCLDFLLNKTSTHGDNKPSIKSNPSIFLVLKIINQTCTVCVDSPCSAKSTNNTAIGGTQQQQQQPRGADGELKYRNDQNVLKSNETQYRLISTEEGPIGEYLTDAGLMVPAISYKLRERFMAAAEAKGITRDRLIELVARTGTELSIQLLGGSRRLNPSNSHQVPLCVVLCGPGRTGE